MKPRKEWQASYNGHEIRVIYTWVNMLQLLIDGDQKDQLNIKAHLGFSEDVFLTSTIAAENSNSATVEVFVKPTFLSIEARICVNGNEISGTNALKSDEIGICTCPCHSKPHAVVHPVECCEKCPKCKKGISRGMMDAHLQTCTGSSPK